MNGALFATGASFRGAPFVAKVATNRVMAVALILALAACTAEATPSPKPACPTEPPTSTSAQASLQGAEIATVTVGGAVDGEFVFELLGDVAPIASANFADLARCGFYDGVKFHRVIAGFVVQAGDPNTRDHEGDFADIGKGGPGYGFEIEPPPASVAFDAYTVAMANNTVANGSQFFITLDDLDQALRAVGTYTIFGEVTSGTDVFDAIAAVPVNDPRIGVPETPVTIESITVGEASAEE
jgi:cyclophilin family peptidyl-prolyl cis-trans isomerase